MRFLDKVHGRRLDKSIVPQGATIEATLEEYFNANKDVCKMENVCRITFEDCHLEKIAEKLNKDNAVQVIREHILKLYDENVGDRFACIYLIAVCLNKLSGEVNRGNEQGKEKIEVIEKTEQLQEIIRLKFWRREREGENGEEDAAEIVWAGITDGIFLGLWNEQLVICDKDFLIKWGYYPSNTCLRDTVKTLKNSENKEWINKTLVNIHDLAEKINTGEITFHPENVYHWDMKQNGKTRTVYSVAAQSNEQILLRYIKRKLDEQFQIHYANRNTIMRLVFEYVKDIEKFSDYTIYRFDIENFFESVDAKIIYEKYIEKSSLDTVVKKNLWIIVQSFPYCYSGLPTSNALVEIAGAEFDRNVMARLMKHGMIFFARYVDDGLIIFNRRVEKAQIQDVILQELENCFGTVLRLHSTKENYLVKENGTEDCFDYLGYEFKRNSKRFVFGITKEKRDKYTAELERIITEYKKNPAELELFRLRVQYFLSRKVFYNNFNSRKSKAGVWDVTGITANYELLRGYINSDRIEAKTKRFLDNVIYEQVRRSGISEPYFLKSDKTKHYTLMKAMKENRSIVFHPNIGWSPSLLQERIHRVDARSLWGKSYRECVDIYCERMKLRR